MLDGIPLGNLSNEASSTGAQIISAIPMASIEKIEILKGPETAVYGVHGANGVVSVFTKTGVAYEYIQRDIPGTVMEKIKGFEPFGNFIRPNIPMKMYFLKHLITEPRCTGIRSLFLSMEKLKFLFLPAIICRTTKFLLRELPVREEHVWALLNLR